MSPKFHKFRLLLDENMPGRRAFALLNHQFDVKHISLDLKKSGVRDEVVYREAVNMHRLIVTFNSDDFKPFVAKSTETGIIAVSDNLSTSQIDNKLVALLVRSSPTSSFIKCATPIWLTLYKLFSACVILLRKNYGYRGEHVTKSDHREPPYVSGSTI